MRWQSLLLPVWVLLGATIHPGQAWSKDGFIDSVLSQYRQTDQASRADTARDGIITEGEFVFSLYGQADARGNNDNQVSREEFLDYYSQLYNISSELATIMFDYLNDPASRDDVITTSDVSLSSFAGRTYATVAEYKEGLEKWLRQSLEKLYSILMAPHVISLDREPVVSYSSILTSIDTNKDNIISVTELNHEIKRFNPNQPASRTDWVWRNSQRYGAKFPDVSSLAFDFYDRDGDLKLTPRDLQMVAENLDYNGDGQIKRDEALRFMERAFSLSQRMTGRPMALPRIQCPEPWWSELEALPSMDALRAALDFDDDLDGWITASDLRRWLDIFDTDDNSYMDLDEYLAFSMERYGLNSTVSKAMFHLADVSGDQKLSEKDWEFHFKDDFALSLCDARRSLLDLARMAGKFQSAQLTGQALRSAMQRKLQEEWRWYQQRRRGGGWAGPGRFGGRGARGRAGKTRFTNVGCLAEGTCYRGEYTEAWGRPGAWMWWGMKESDSAAYYPGNPFGQMPRPSLGDAAGAGGGAGNVFPGASSPGAMPFFPAQAMFGAGNRPVFGQFQFPSLPTGSEASVGGRMMPQFFPFKRETLMNSADPNSPVSASKREKAENYFSHYQQLFTPFVADDFVNKEHNDGSISNPISTNDSPNQPKDDSMFPTNEQNSLDNSVRSQEEITSERPVAPPSETPEASFNADKADSGIEDLYDPRDDVSNQQQFPFMGVPVFIGFDPWFFGGAPGWGLVGRMKRKGDEDIEAQHNTDENGTKTDANKNIDILPRLKREVLNERKRDMADGTPPNSSQDLVENDEDDNSSNGTDFENFDGLSRGIWPTMMGPGAPPLAFGISPIDFWAAMMLENAMLSPGHWIGDDDWLASQNESLFEGNVTDESEQQWWLPETWRPPIFDPSSTSVDPERSPDFDPSSSVSDQESQEDNRETSERSNMSRRNKRFAGQTMSPGYYFPYYYSPSYYMRMRMMANMMRRRYQYPYFSRMFRNPWNYGYGQYNWYPYVNSWYRWYMYGRPYMNNYWANQGVGNAVWRRTAKNHDQKSRSKRESDMFGRAKRWQRQELYPTARNWNWRNGNGKLWNGYDWSNKWDNAWTNNFWKRQADEENSKKRLKRDADRSSREKRWQGNTWSPRRYRWTMWNRYGNWQPRWDTFSNMNSWSNNFWKRDTLPSGNDEQNEKWSEVGSRDKRSPHRTWYPSGYDDGVYFKRWDIINKINQSPADDWIKNQKWQDFGKRDVLTNEKSLKMRKDTAVNDREKRWQDNRWGLGKQDWNGWPVTRMFSDNSQWLRGGHWNNFWKRDIQVDESNMRTKRNAERGNIREKRWQNNMWSPSRYMWQHYRPKTNKWDMSDNMYQNPSGYRTNIWRNSFWKRDVEGNDKSKRYKRSTDNGERIKRWQSGSWYPEMSWQWYSPTHNRQGYPGWGSFSGMPGWRHHGNSLWKRNTPGGSENSKTKREADGINRNKRYGMWNSRSPFWNRGRWYSPNSMWYMYQGWNPYNSMSEYNMWKRNVEDESVESRTKREANDLNREKRYGTMWSSRPNYWNRWSRQWSSPDWGMNQWWNQYDNNYGNQMWKRGSDVNSETTRTKRDTETVVRNRRFGMMGNFNRWPSQWYFPSSSWNMNQWWNPYNNNYGNQMWKRDSGVNSENTRSKRDIENGERSKRYGMMGNFNWNRWPSQWYFPSSNWHMNQGWNQHYGMHGWSNYGNQMWKRDTEENEENRILKRDTGSVERDKRYGMMGNFDWNRWSSPWYSSFSNTHMRPWWNRNNGMYGSSRYGNQMWKRDAENKEEENEEGIRSKRESDGQRDKRYGMMRNFDWNRRPWQGYSSSNNWPTNNWRSMYGGMPYWDFYTNQMWKRESDGGSEAGRAKRDTSDTARAKRYGPTENFRSTYGSWPWYSPYNNRYMNRWWSPHSGMSSMFHSGNQMWKRDTEEATHHEEDSATSNRNKRYGMMGTSYGNQWPSQQYFPWSFHQWRRHYGGMPFWYNYGNQMWRRDSEENAGASRERRDTEEKDRAKRYGMWGNYGSPQGNSWSWQRFSPYSNWYMNQMWDQYDGMSGFPTNGNQWKRGAGETQKESREKRDTREIHRAKRYGSTMNFRSPHSNSWSWQWQYPYNNWNQYQMWSPYSSMYSNKYSMWKRETDKNTKEVREKRDTENLSRNKRYGMWNYRPMYWSNWPWQWQYPFYDWNMFRYNPYFSMSNWFNYRNQMWKRSKQDETETPTTKRDTEKEHREKRSPYWNRWQWQSQSQFPANNWYRNRGQDQYSNKPYRFGNNQFWKRDTEEDSETSQTKRDVTSASREKRYGMIDDFSSDYWTRWPLGNGYMQQWNNPQSDMYNRFTGEKQMWKRNIDTETEDLETNIHSSSINRDKRFARMRNHSPIHWNRWPWHWYSSHYNWYMYRLWSLYNGAPYWFNYGPQMWKRNINLEEEPRKKRDVDAAEREKRYGRMWNSRSPYWNRWSWQWSRPSYNWQMYRMPSWNYYENQMWKRGAEEKEDTPRTKRDTEKATRNKRFGMMWNRWPGQFYSPSNSWQMNNWWNSYGSMPNRFRYRNQMWKRESEKETGSSKAKRDINVAQRAKRYGVMWNSRSPFWNRGQSYSPYSMWSMNQGWNPYSSMSRYNMWKRNVEDESEESRPKREANDLNREKRYGTMWRSRPNYWNRWSWQSFSPDWGMNQWWNQYNFGNQMWKRDAEVNDESARSKRDIGTGERSKRYGMMGSFNNYWNRWPSQWYFPSSGWDMNQWWNQYRNNYGSQMWKRDSEVNDGNERSKRDTEAVERSKRYGMMGSFNWDRWPSQWYFPSNNWNMNQWWNRYSNNYGSQMWKRDSEVNDGNERSKRDTEAVERSKRYGMMGSFNWDRWPSQWYFPSNNWNMNQWWNRYSNNYGNQMWKRDSEGNSKNTRSKRDIENGERSKRYGMMGNFNWNRWPSQWYYPSNNWHMNQGWNQYGGMQGWSNYGNQMWKRDTEEIKKGERSKRDAESPNRGKRFGMMGTFDRGNWPWQQYSSNWRMNQQWNGYNRMPNWMFYGNQMWKREAKKGNEDNKTKRDTDATNREKRYDMMWNYQAPFWNRWHTSSNTWQDYPWWNMPNWFNYGNQMWKRGTENESEENVTKGDTESVSRQKRYGMMGNFGSPYWNRVAWQWYFPYNQYSGIPGSQMWKRDTEDDTDDDTDEKRAKRSAEGIQRDKRYGQMWNSDSWRFYYPYNWHRSRGPFTGMSDWSNYRNQMWRRDSEKDIKETRIKRDTVNAERQKRYGMWNYGTPYWNRWSRQWGSPYSSWYTPNWFGGRMWRRDAEEDIDVSRAKRDTEDADREKRNSMMWDFMSPYSNRWFWQWYSPFSYWYMPGRFDYSMSGNQMWKRNTEKDSEEPRRKRNVDNTNRTKRYGMMSHSSSPFWNRWSSQRYSPSNSWFMHQDWNSGFPRRWNYGMAGMWKRNTQDALEVTRAKRDVESLERKLRQNGETWSESLYPWLSFFNKGVTDFFSNDNWRDQLWKRNTQDKLDERSKRDAFDSNTQKRNSEAKKGKEAGTNKRQFSYNKKTSPSAKSTNNEESVWRSAKKKYGEQSTWQRQMDQGNTKWQHGLNQNYGFSSNRWANGAMPNNYQTNPRNWLKNQAASTGTSWQKYNSPAMFQGRNLNSMDGIRSGLMPTMMNRGRFGGMSDGSAYAQPYSNQWGRGFNADANPGIGWPVDWSSTFSLPGYGSFGVGPLGFRYYRKAGIKRGAEAVPSAKSLEEGEVASTSRKKREAEFQEDNLSRDKRWSHNYNNNGFFNYMSRLYRYNRMRQMWAPWFFYSFCQRQPFFSSGGMFRYRRNATGTDKDANVKTGRTATAQWTDSEKEKRQEHFYRGGGHDGSGYNHNWQYYRWMCPRAWSMMRGNFGSPNYNRYNFLWGGNNPYSYYQQQQRRWKRSALEGQRSANVRDSKGDEDFRERRQWGNLWQNWRGGRGPQDCEEWIAPMPAWSPWRGWNMLRKTRETSASQNEIERGGEKLFSPGETSDQSPTEKENEQTEERSGNKAGVKVKRASHRCRSWRGQNFNSQNMAMNMAMRNRPNFDRVAMSPWARNWMGGNRWGQMRIRRDTTSGSIDENTEENGRSKRWSSGMTWHPGFGQQRFWNWSPPSSMNQWSTY